MVIKSYHIILAVKILGWFLLKWAGFGELLGWKSSTRSGNTVHQWTCQEQKFLFFWPHRWISHHFTFSQSCVSLEFLLLNPAVRPTRGWNSRTLVCLLSSTPSHSLLLLSFNDILVIFQHHIKRHRRKSKLLLQLNLFYIDCFSKNSANMWCGQQIIYLHSLWASCVKKCCGSKTQSNIRSH